MRRPSAWKVHTVRPSPASPFSRRATRSFISRADLLVKVIAAIRFAGERPEPTRCAIFSTITRVLPLPAPASTSSGPSTCRTASRWGGLSIGERNEGNKGNGGCDAMPGAGAIVRSAGPHSLYSPHSPPMAKLYFYYSAMNAGKTTTLLQSAHNYRERGMRVAILTPLLDHRDGSGTVASRIGLRADGTPFTRDDDLERMVRASVENNGPLHCVLVDEAQFLTRAQVWQLSEVVD